MKHRRPCNFAPSLPPTATRIPARRILAPVSTTELLTVVAIGAVLVAVSVLALGKAQQARSLTACTANLRNIALAFQSYLIDNAAHYPAPSTDAQWEDLLRKYVHRPTFRCPADQELFPSLGSSYDWRDTGDPTTTLAGVLTFQISRGNVSLAFDSLPGWHQPKKVQVVNTDGVVQLEADEPFLQELQSPITSGP